uniref:Uncharacterized protein n=1 Tax=Rangifer tarandus platyrhynchus TaxID=3082113 RepID=A0ACB0EMM8_RANTA|nr:unnamed protein product [Rangifer tarandus platyrhynchus]
MSVPRGGLSSRCLGGGCSLRRREFPTAGAPLEVQRAPRAARPRSVAPGSRAQPQQTWWMGLAAPQRLLLAKVSLFMIKILATGFTWIDVVLKILILSGLTKSEDFFIVAQLLGKEQAQD